MKKVSIACLAGLLFFAACENSGSSTVGTYEQEEQQSNNKEEGAKEEAPKEEHTGHEGIMTDTTLPAPSDTATMKVDTTAPQDK